MNIELTKREQDFLIEFAKKQHDGAKDNVGTMTPIHVVERIRTEYVENPKRQLRGIKPVTDLFSIWLIP